MKLHAAPVRSITEWMGEADASLIPVSQVCGRTAPEGFRYTPYLALLEDVRLLPREWLLLSNAGGVLLDGLHHTLPLNPGKSAWADSFADGVMQLRVPQEETLVEQAAVLLGNMSNHYHWLVDYLPRLAIVEAQRELDGLPLVVGSDLEAGQTQMLGHLGVAPERLLKLDLDRVHRFRQLWVPAQLVDRMRLHPGAIEWMHARIARPGQCVRRMFISRRDAARRRLVNEDEIIDIVSAHGFEIVLPAMLNQVDQARLFAEAASVIGVAGAGLTNMLFAPTGATLIELHNFAKGAEFFQRLCAQRDQRYARVWGELLPAPDIPPNHYDFRLDPAFLRSWMSHF